MLTVILWCLTACLCGVIAAGCYTLSGLAYDYSLVRFQEWKQRRELEAEVHLKALRSASREVD